MDNLMHIISIFIYCFIATAFFCYLMNSPKKTILLSSLISAFGYIIYEIIFLNNSESIFIAYFLASLFISVSGEIISKILKIPSLIVIFPAVIPLVPGIGLYHSLISFIQKNMDLFTKYAYETLFISLIIASTIAITRSIFNVFNK